jgi:hypothetical protein
MDWGKTIDVRHATVSLRFNSLRGVDDIIILSAIPYCTASTLGPAKIYYGRVTYTDTPYVMGTGSAGPGPDHGP